MIAGGPSWANISWNLAVWPICLRPSAAIAPHAQGGASSAGRGENRVVNPAAVAFLNTHTSAVQKVTFRPAEPLSGQLRTWTYSAGNQNAANSASVQGTASSSSLARGITLPPESLVVLGARLFPGES
jgi:hypothetical protein